MCVFINSEAFAPRKRGGLYKEAQSPDQCRYQTHAFHKLLPIFHYNYLSLNIHTVLYNSNLLTPVVSPIISAFQSTIILATPALLHRFIFYQRNPFHTILPLPTASACLVMTKTVPAPTAKTTHTSRKSLLHRRTAWTQASTQVCPSLLYACIVSLMLSGHFFHVFPCI